MYLEVQLNDFNPLTLNSFSDLLPEYNNVRVSGSTCIIFQ